MIIYYEGEKREHYTGEDAWVEYDKEEDDDKSKKKKKNKRDEEKDGKTETLKQHDEWYCHCKYEVYILKTACQHWAIIIVVVTCKSTYIQSVHVTRKYEIYQISNS